MDERSLPRPLWRRKSSDGVTPCGPVSRGLSGDKRVRRADFLPVNILRTIEKDGLCPPHAHPPPPSISNLRIIPTFPRVLGSVHGARAQQQNCPLCVQSTPHSVDPVLRLKLEEGRGGMVEVGRREVFRSLTSPGIRDRMLLGVRRCDPSKGLPSVKFTLLSPICPNCGHVMLLKDEEFSAVTEEIHELKTIFTTNSLRR